MAGAGVVSAEASSAALVQPPQHASPSARLPEPLQQPASFVDAGVTAALSPQGFEQFDLSQAAFSPQDFADAAVVRALEPEHDAEWQQPWAADFAAEAFVHDALLLAAETSVEQHGVLPVQSPGTATGNAAEITDTPAGSTEPQGFEHADFADASVVAALSPQGFEQFAFSQDFLSEASETHAPPHVPQQPAFFADAAVV